MSDLSIIKAEYIQLVNKLNLGNNLENEVTSEYFFIDRTFRDKYKLFMALNKMQKKLLCESADDVLWFPAYFSGFDELEKFICVLLRGKKVSE